MSTAEATPKASIVTPAICVMMLVKLPGVKKLSALNEKNRTMSARPIRTGQLPRLPALMLLRIL